MTYKIEVKGEYKLVQVRKLNTDGTYKRYVLSPSDNITNEPQEVKDVCNANWTQAVKDAWSSFKTQIENERITAEARTDT